jgi:hypothetical protein
MLAKDDNIDLPGRGNPFADPPVGTNGRGAMMTMGRARRGLAMGEREHLT